MRPLCWAHHFLSFEPNSIKRANLFVSKCLVCHKNRSGTIFECTSSHLLSDTDEIEFEVYSEVDLTRQSLSACATGTTMKGTLFLCFLL